MGYQKSAHVLVVDDDPTVADVVVNYLKHAGMRAEHVDDGLRAVKQFRSATERNEPYDLVVLDLMLPTIGGLEVCRRLREPIAPANGANSLASPTPVIMLTARGDEEDRVLGLEVGADDYMTKPFSPRELVLRIKSVLRRTQAPPPREMATSGPATPERLTDGNIEVDISAHRARVGGAELALTAREFDLLAFLLANPGQAFSREELMQRVWQWEYGDRSTVTVHVRRLREKVEADPTQPTRLVTVWGVGYRWDPATAIVEAAPAPVGTTIGSPAGAPGGGPSGGLGDTT